ncbi:MAG TPA: MG2 domain-containing protein, partial [Flavobacteriales bacterium]|nr:MG2 domain-containing protein [Flavobacteriales bacterium]
MSSVHLRIVKLTTKEAHSFGRYMSYEDLKKFKHVFQRKPVVSWKSPLPSDEGDFQMHSVEIKIPALDYGNYVLLAADNADFSINNTMLTQRSLRISDLGYTHRETKNNNQEFTVYNRRSGKPQAGVIAEIYKNEYNSSKHGNVQVKTATYTTDSNGRFMHSAPRERGYYFFIRLIQGKDILCENSSFDSYPYNESGKKEKRNVYFFTDRSIYRPGQTIYFKGVMLGEKDKVQRILPGEKTTVYFNDWNYQEIAKIEVVTNEYGTFSGTFTAPQRALDGVMIITTSYEDGWGGGRKMIRVEEYKRPKFEVTYENVQGSFRPGDPIKVKGIAKSYSGANIDNAQVRYRVERRVRIPYWMYYWYDSKPSTFAVTILQGSTKTDTNGNFEVEFTAVPDHTVSKEADPIFTYTLIADVTDINGETRS